MGFHLGFYFGVFGFNLVFNLGFNFGFKLVIISPNPFHNALITNSKLPSHNVIFSIASTKKIPSQNATRPFQSIKMTFCTLQLDALPCPLEPPNEMVREKEGHALPNTFKNILQCLEGHALSS